VHLDYARCDTSRAERRPLLSMRHTTLSVRALSRTRRNDIRARISSGTPPATLDVTRYLVSSSTSKFDLLKSNEEATAGFENTFSNAKTHRQIIAVCTSATLSDRNPCQFERFPCQFERSREHVRIYTS
jgi:hypothetical protein